MLTGSPIKQNGLAISYVCFPKKNTRYLVYTDLIFCFQIVENCIRAK